MALEQVAGWRLSGGCGGGDGVPPSSTAPRISYDMSGDIELSTDAVANPTPTNTGGVADLWSISPPLPAGLAFNASNGSITGTPAEASAPATYVVTATNEGESGSVTLTLRAQAMLLDLGHSSGLRSIAMTDSRILSLDVSPHWALWDYQSAALLASGDVPCPPSSCSYSEGGPPRHAELAGPTVVIQTPDRLDVRSSVDGRSLGTITPVPRWWHVAADGSYVCGGTTTSLTARAPNATVIVCAGGSARRSRAGRIKCDRAGG